MIRQHIRKGHRVYRLQSPYHGARSVALEARIPFGDALDVRGVVAAHDLLRLQTVVGHRPGARQGGGIEEGLEEVWRDGWILCAGAAGAVMIG